MQSVEDKRKEHGMYSKIVLCLSVKEDDVLEKAKNKGIATNDPQKMRESYAKAMEMLKAMGVKGVQK